MNSPLFPRGAAMLALGLGFICAAGAFAAPPANDDCANAFEPFTTPYDFLGITDEATTDGSNGCSTSGKDVWFKIIPPATALYTLDSCGSTFDSVISVHAGACPGTDATQIACNDNGCGDDGTLTLTLVKDLTYHVRIAGVNSAFGGYAFHVGTPVLAPEAPAPGCNIIFAVTSEPGGSSSPFLKTIDAATGQATELGQIQGTNGLITAIAFDAPRGRIFAIGYQSGNPVGRFSFIDPATRTSIDGFLLDYIGRVTDLAFDASGRLFGYGENGSLRTLLEFNPAQGNIIANIGLSLGGTYSGLAVNSADELIMVDNGIAVRIDKDTGSSLSLGSPTYFFQPPFLDVNAPGLLELDTDPVTGKIFGLATGGGGNFGGAGLIYYDEPGNSVVLVAQGGYEPTTAAFAFGCRCVPPDTAAIPSPQDAATDVELTVDLEWETAQPSINASAATGKPGPQAVIGSAIFSSGPPADEQSLYEMSTIKYAADFYVPSGTVIRSIRFWTLETGSGYDGTGFPWSFRTNSGVDAPGAIIALTTSFPTLREPTGRMIGGQTEYVNEINTFPFFLERGKYWLTLQEGQNCIQDNVFWARSAGAYGQRPQFSIGCLPDAFTGLSEGNPDPAFEIFGEPDGCDLPDYTVLFDTVDPPVTTLATELSLPQYTVGSLDPDTTYYWQVITDTNGGSTPGPVWSFSTYAIPANDNCADAADLIGGYQYNDTTRASIDGFAGCNGSGADIWYRYVPTATGSATVGTCGSILADTAITVHSGCPGTLVNQIACNDNSAGPNCSGGFAAEVGFPVTAGQEYLIRVAGTFFTAGPVTVRLDGPLPDRRDKGDFDSDGCTDLDDFLFLLDYWQTVSPIGGAQIDIDDFLALLDYWQTGPGCS